MSRLVTELYSLFGRPVKIVQKPDGDVDYQGFNSVTGLFGPPSLIGLHQSIFSCRELGDPLDEDGFAELVATLRTEILVSYAERLCHTLSGTEAGLRQALMVPMQPLPLGAALVSFRNGAKGFASVTFEFEEGTLSRRTLDSRLGDPRILPSTDPRAPHFLLYEVSVPRAKSSVSIIASLADCERQDSIVSATLRVDQPRARL